MKRSVTFLLLLVAVVVNGEPPQARLRWCNGETIPGSIAEASALDVTWKTPLFDDPLQLRWSALRRVDQTLAAVPVSDPFSFALRDGSSLHGDLVAVTDATVSIHCARCGDAVLKRAEVLSVRRLQGGKLIAAGPVGDVGWDLLSNRKEPDVSKKNRAHRNAPGPSPAIPTLVLGPDGALRMPYWNSGAFLDAGLPELVDLEFRVHASARPDFRLSLEGGPKQRLRIETWDKELVLVAADRFKAVRKIAEDEREISLRLCWDQKKGKCSVFTPSGEPLTDWDVPQDPDSTDSGLVLQGNGRDLALDFLRVRTWDGNPPPRIDVVQPRVELADGRIIAGRLGSSPAGSITLQTPGSDSDETFPLDQVDAIIFSTDPPSPRGQAATLAYADGTLLIGRIARIKDGRVVVETTFAEEPVAAQIAGLRQLLIDTPMQASAAAEPPFVGLDKFEVQQSVLHGKLASGGDHWPRFLPVGGLHPVRPASGLPDEITRFIPPDAVLPKTPALFYTRTGDILPGILHALDRSGVEFESGILETTKLPADNLAAIQFDPVPRMNIRGFDEPGWRIVKGEHATVRATKDSLGMDPETSFAHPEAMQCDEIKFAFGLNSSSTVRLRLFCAGTDPAKSSSLVFSYSENEVDSGLETADGELDSQEQTAVLPGKPAEVRLLVQEKAVELFVNDVFIHKFPMNPAKRAGSGLIIEPASLWGNQVGPIALSAFSAVSGPGRPWLPDVSPELRAQVLTVPRFRRDDPPRHVLLASNGNVLRGEIEAVTADHFGFRSGLENFAVPRDRVKAAIWLRQPDLAALPPAKENPVRKRLEQPIGEQIQYGGIGLQQFTKVIEHEAGDLKFKLPGKQDDRQFPMQFGGQTIGEALDQLCELFGLCYRLDDGGTIVLESAAQARKAMVEKVYWLRADAFPKGSSAKDLLAAKGIAFPSGADALWQPEAGQLVVTNTAANQRDLARVLGTDFGPVLGSPTHWLWLASGAKLGLAVDKFDTGSVSGHHPIYGRCNVPMADIYAIRTSIPEATAAVKSIEDWRLVFAPEPVLPEAGGESSAALGKAAQLFKLPLLEGGDFDLSRQKGKIVVLDFWATWCGPCIKSLPGLIDAMSPFDPDKVKLVGINQGEPSEQVKRFLETRGWKLAVALDSEQSVARDYGVDGIPHTVILGPDGKVAWAKTGYTPDGEIEAVDAVKRLLAPPSSADAPSTAASP